MLRNKLNIFAVVLSLVATLFTGCKKQGEDELSPSNHGKTYLQFSMAGIQMPNASTRAQGNVPSINTDANDFEDYVGELAVLVYEATTGKKVKSHFTTYKSFTMEMEPVDGTNYHFCFVANYPQSWKNTLEGMKSYEDVALTLRGLQTFKSRDNGVELYNGASADAYFPMARIYENQAVTKGGSITNPIPFTPITTSAGSVDPVSTWSESTETPGIQKTVNLVRSSAKIGLTLTGEGLKDVTKVELVNVPTQHSFMELAANKLPETLEPKTFQGTFPTTESSFYTQMYIPERLLGVKAKTEMGWDASTSQMKGNPTYIKIAMKSGRIYTIPVITNKESDWKDKVSTADYLDMAMNNVAGVNANYSIVRNNNYQFNVNIPLEGKDLNVRLKVMPWNLIENNFSATDDYMNASKEDVVLNYPKGDSNEFVLLTTFQNRNYEITYGNPDDKWFEITPSNSSVILSGNQTFSVRTLSDNLGNAPRTATITFEVEEYDHNVSVRIIQLPRQDIVTRKYVNFIGTGGTVNISVDNYGYDWRAEVVENYSTIAGTPDWITLNKSDSKLTINVKSTNDVNLLRYAVVKVYDGSNRASYIWVEQGNYKAVTVNGYTILDRNLGALKTATDRNAWPAGAPISNQERVRVNGFYYQWGRVPDGYHWHGIDVVNGNISTSLADAQVDSTRVDYATHPDGMPLKWWDPVVPGSQDPQYGRFIAADPWLSLSTSGSFPQLWGDPEKVGVDPCPEGYRVPTLAEMNRILSNLVYIESSQGFWAESSDGTTDVYFPRAQFRDFNGTLNDWLVPGTFSTFYLTSENSKVSSLITNETQAKEYNNPVSVSYGIPVRCIKK